MLRRHCLSSSWHQRLRFLIAKREQTRCNKNGIFPIPHNDVMISSSSSYHHWQHHGSSLLLSTQSFSSFCSKRSSSSSTRSNSNNAKEPISEAQRRNAQLELEQMSKSTTRLLAITPDDSSSITDAMVNEARVALHYWSRRWYMHFHPGFGRAAKGSALSVDALRNNSFFDPLEVPRGSSRDDDPSTAAADGELSTSIQRSGDYGARQAEILLDWSISHNLIPRGIFNLEGICSPLEYHPNEEYYGSSPNMTLAHIIDTYLLPCAYNGVGCFGGYSNEEQINLLVEEDNQRHYATLSKHYTKNPHYIKAVVDATRIMKKMRELQTSFPDHISPDTLSIKSELNVWSKRSMILGSDHVGVQTGGILAGNIIAGHHNNLDPKERLKSLEKDDVLDDRFYTLRGCLDEMERILTNAEEQYCVNNDDSMKPSVDWYNHILGSWARSDLEEAPVRAIEMLRGMEAYDGVHIRPDESVRPCWAKPDSVSYNSVLFCLARCGKAQEALNLFRQLSNRYRQSNNDSIRPDDVTYGSVLHALAQVGKASDAERILDSIEEEFLMTPGAVVPSLTIYNTVLNAWANSVEHTAPRRAELLLERMKTLSSTGKNPNIEPDAVSFSTVMSCHARSKRKDGALRSEELLDQAITAYSQGNVKMKPDSIMFNCAILAWAHCSVSGYDTDTTGRTLIPAERAEMLLHRLLEMRENGSLEIAPMAQTYNLVLDSWAKSQRRDAADRALNLMRNMPKAGVTPDECSYNSVLNAISKQEDVMWLKRAEELFQEILELNRSGNLTISDMTYNVMINVCGKSSDPEGARKAENILRDMEVMGISPSTISYNSCIDAFARRGDINKAESLLNEMIQFSKEGREELTPTIHSFAALVNALSNSNARDAIDRAEEIVNKVEELGFVKPNTVLYNSLIHTIVKSGAKDSSARANRVLKRMEEARLAGNLDVSPDSFAYSMVLTLCARSKEPDAAIRASTILVDMEKLHAQGRNEVIANSRCYSAAITAWARSGSPDAVRQALDLLDRMEQNRQINSPHGAPNAHVYNSVIHAIAKSQELEKVKYCKDILQRMNRAKDAGDLDSAPTVITYSTIVNACAYTTGNQQNRREAFELARSCFQTLIESKELEPDESIFANLFLVMCRHLGKGEARDRFAEAIFKEACELGKVDNQVLYHFRNASPSVAKRILSHFQTDCIPNEWCWSVGKIKRKS